ncbi:unnamed protein product [Nippostrongylus brasiliensis]|uniref:Protein LLP homolog n=1 Tax=Nippostrongylus brasiliensis TaxID=27835 RepID=A0A0N4YPQ6_NIPBR|nr:hypothetical protein Q1695_005847 [Nippostrongylus brasiliensis]VDL82957.1 unnamed protein product [Nippostrongylus brasiliensis]
MAKSLRSKFKRKMRSIARVKKAPKELARLEEAVARREVYELEQAAKEAEAAKKAPGTDKLEEMDDSSAKKATINVKTMKRADGTYPPWMSGALKNKLSKKNKALKKRKQQKAKSRR